MKTLAELEEKIYKCSKCGLCQNVCPLYKTTGNECNLSRGKFILLNGILHKHLKMNKDIMHYINFCLNCNACKDFCPSNIDAQEILTTARFEYNKNSFLNSYFVFKTLLYCLKFFCILYRFFRIDKFVEYNENKIKRLGNYGLLLCSLNELIKNKKISNKKYYLKNNKRTLKIAFFRGCSNKYINNSSEKFFHNICKKMDIQIITPKFECCGMKFYQKGNLKELKKLISKNLSLLPNDIDYIVTDCASCDGMLRHYAEFADKEEQEKINLLNKKLINIFDFLHQINFFKEFKNKPTFTYHKPCHFVGNDKNLPLITNAKYVKMQDYSSCCGFAGTFGLKNLDITQKISLSKIKNINNTNTQYLVTNCNSCIIGLKLGLLANNSNIKVINLMDFLNIQD